MNYDTFISCRIFMVKHKKEPRFVQERLRWKEGRKRMGTITINERFVV